MTGEEHAFTAKIRREGPLYIVDVPARISKIFDNRGRIPVVAQVKGGTPVRCTLVPAGGGKHKMFVNGGMRREAGKGEGDRIVVTVRLDRESREVETPRDLLEALRESDVVEFFARYPPGHRRHVIDWLDDVKSEEARERRIAKVIERVLADHERRLDGGK